jgi:glycosyltransferase involved in cell wall biosynthesis
MILMSHPLANANVRNAALALSDAGMLAELWTCLQWKTGGFGDRLIPRRFARELGRRSFPVTVRGRVRTSPLREAGRLLASHLPGGDWLTRHEAGWCSVDAVFQALDRRVARRAESLVREGTPLSGVYCYEDAAASTFKVAGRLGCARFYDLPIGYWRAGQDIFAEEAERKPEWAPTLTGRSDSAAKLARKDDELQMADAVIVASSFTRQTLLTAPAFRAPIHVVPYGAPAAGPLPAPETESGTGGSRKLRVLFAGALGQRKGLAYLLAGIRPLAAHVELTLLGGKTARDCAPLEEAVRQHRWLPSLPHADVLAEMARQDVLVFPSLFEGFGLVILEAMSRGLPVIATPHTAGPDLITDGVEGFIIPIRSPAAITEKLELLLRDPARLAAMKAAAHKKAEALTWQTYRTRLSGIVAQTLGRGQRIAVSSY